MGVSFGIGAAGWMAYTFPDHGRFELECLDENIGKRTITIGYVNHWFPIPVVHRSGEMTDEERQQYRDEVVVITQKIFDERNWFWKWMYPGSCNNE